jgi:hypothetical protein
MCPWIGVVMGAEGDLIHLGEDPTASAVLHATVVVDCAVFRAMQQDRDRHFSGKSCPVTLLPHTNFRLPKA